MDWHPNRNKALQGRLTTRRGGLIAGILVAALLLLAVAGAAVASTNGRSQKSHVPGHGFAPRRLKAHRSGAGDAPAHIHASRRLKAHRSQTSDAPGHSLAAGDSFAPRRLKAHRSSTPRTQLSALRIAAGVESLSPSWSAPRTAGLAGFRIRWRLAQDSTAGWSSPVLLSAHARSYTIAGLSAARAYEVRVQSIVRSHHDAARAGADGRRSHGDAGHRRGHRRHRHAPSVTNAAGGPITMGSAIPLAKLVQDQPQPAPQAAISGEAPASGVSAAATVPEKGKGTLSGQSNLRAEQEAQELRQEEQEIEQEERSVHEGEAPREGEAPKEGEGSKEGEAPKEAEAPKEGEGPHESPSESAGDGSAGRPKPMDLQIAPGVGSLKPSWGVSSTARLKGFRVRWRGVGPAASGWTKPVELGPDARSYAIAGLTQGAAYEVRIRAMADGGGGGVLQAVATTLRKNPQKEREHPKEKEAPEEKEAPKEEETPKEEEAPKEEPPHEEEAPSGEGVVAAAPSGPSTPAGGWSVVFADAFAVPFAQDPYWSANDGKPLNSDEMEVFNPSQVKTDSEGLQLTMRHQAGAGNYNGKTQNYVSGFAQSDKFWWENNQPGTFVFEIDCRFPPNTGETDLGFWGDNAPYGDGTETDLFETGGWGNYNTESSGWSKSAFYMAVVGGGISASIYNAFSNFDPSAAFHRYTIEVKEKRMSMWIDGQPVAGFQNLGPGNAKTVELPIWLSYAAREPTGHASGFTSGERKWTVRSVAVYRDTDDLGVGYKDGGLAPGTKVG